VGEEGNFWFSTIASPCSQVTDDEMKARGGLISEEEKQSEKKTEDEPSGSERHALKGGKGLEIRKEK